MPKCLSNYEPFLVPLNFEWRGVLNNFSTSEDLDSGVNLNAKRRKKIEGSNG